MTRPAFVLISIISIFNKVQKFADKIYFIAQR